MKFTAKYQWPKDCVNGDPEGAMISAEIAFLLVLASVVGGLWLATIIIGKTKRSQGKRAIEREFARHFPPLTRRRPKPASEAQIVTPTVKVAPEKQLS